MAPDFESNICAQTWLSLLKTARAKINATLRAMAARVKHKTVRVKHKTVKERAETLPLRFILRRVC
jgi:hypothetical protein